MRRDERKREVGLLRDRAGDIELRPEALSKWWKVRGYNAKYASRAS